MVRPLLNARVPVERHLVDVRRHVFQIQRSGHVHPAKRMHVKSHLKRFAFAPVKPPLIIRQRPACSFQINQEAPPLPLDLVAPAACLDAFSWIDRKLSFQSSSYRAAASFLSFQARHGVPAHPLRHVTIFPVVSWVVETRVLELRDTNQRATHVSAYHHAHGSSHLGVCSFEQFPPPEATGLADLACHLKRSEACKRLKQLLCCPLIPIFATSRCLVFRVPTFSQRRAHVVNVVRCKKSMSPLLVAIRGKITKVGSLVRAFACTEKTRATATSHVAQSVPIVAYLPLMIPMTRSRRGMKKMRRKRLRELGTAREMTVTKLCRVR